jgi:predicted membrane channel-forming protein YqfA (hemolysin III family)
MPRNSTDTSSGRVSGGRRDRGERLPVPPGLRVLISLAIAVLVVWSADAALSFTPPPGVLLLMTAGLAALIGTIALAAAKRQRR